MNIISERDRYQRYLCSREWNAKKEAVHHRARGKCERCFHNPLDAVHHLTYERKYHEELEDLQAICGPCHEFIHGKRDHDVFEDYRFPTRPAVLQGLIELAERHDYLIIWDDIYGLSEKLISVAPVETLWDMYSERTLNGAASESLDVFREVLGTVVFLIDVNRRCSEYRAYGSDWRDPPANWSPPGDPNTCVIPSFAVNIDQLIHRFGTPTKFGG